MGACLEPTEDMGHYRVEMRGESAYVNANLREFNAWRMGERADPPRRTIFANPPGQDGFTVPVEDVPPLLAAVTQVIGHPTYARWWSGVNPSAQIPVEVWGADIIGDMVRIVGPAHTITPNGSPGAIGSVEVEYAAMAGLRAMLGVLVVRLGSPRLGADLDGYSTHPTFEAHVSAVAARMGLDLDVTAPSPVTGPMVADLVDALGPVIVGPELDARDLTLLAAGFQALADITWQQAERALDVAAEHAFAPRLSDHPAFDW